VTAAGPRSERQFEPVTQTPAQPDDAAAFAPPDPFAVSEPAGAAHADPFASPPPESAVAGLQPFAAPEVNAAAAPDPFASPQPPAVADPFAPAPAADAAPSYSPLGTAGDDGAHVPDWSGFSEPEPGLEPAYRPEPQPAIAEPAVSARPAGVSIPPPGWTGAA
jgi:hypothetical protein